MLTWNRQQGCGLEGAEPALSAGGRRTQRDHRGMHYCGGGGLMEEI